MFIQRCRFEKQARLKRYAESPKDKTKDNKKPITISVSASDEPKVPQTPVKIPVKHTSSYSDRSQTPIKIPVKQISTSRKFFFSIYIRNKRIFICII